MREPEKYGSLCHNRTSIEQVTFCHKEGLENQSKKSKLQSQHYQ